MPDRTTDAKTLSRVARSVPALVIGGLMLVGGSLGGCAGVPQAEYDEVFNENIEVRQRLGRFEAALEESEANNGSLLERNRELVERIEELSAQNAAPGSGAQAGGDGSGFTMRGSDAVITVAGDVLFASGQASIKADGQRELSRIAGRIQREFPSARIRVEGYTDTDQISKSSWEDNEELSAARALAVERYLVSRGIPADRVYAAAMGPASPKGTKAASRRVEIVVLGAG